MYHQKKGTTGFEPYSSWHKTKAGARDFKHDLMHSLGPPDTCILLTGMIHCGRSLYEIYGQSDGTNGFRYQH